MATQSALWAHHNPLSAPLHATTRVRGASCGVGVLMGSPLPSTPPIFSPKAGGSRRLQLASSSATFNGCGCVICRCRPRGDNPECIQGVRSRRERPEIRLVSAGVPGGEGRHPPPRPPWCLLHSLVCSIKEMLMTQGERFSQEEVRAPSHPLPTSHALHPDRPPALLPAPATNPFCAAFSPWLFPGRSIRCSQPSPPTCLATWITKTLSMSLRTAKRRTSPRSARGLAPRDGLSLGWTEGSLCLSPSATREWPPH